MTHGEQTRAIAQQWKTDDSRRAWDVSPLFLDVGLVSEKNERHSGSHAPIALPDASGLAMPHADVIIVPVVAQRLRNPPSQPDFPGRHFLAVEPFEQAQIA